MAIRRCLPEHLFIVAHMRICSLVNAPICTVTFTAVGYKRPCCKRQLKPVRASFRMCMSDEALTSMPHLLRVGNVFLYHFTLTVHGCNINRPNGLSVDPMGLILIENYGIFFNWSIAAFQKYLRYHGVADITGVKRNKHFIKN